MGKIDELKKHPEVYRVYASRVKVAKNGDYWIGYCPMHADNSTESLSLFWKDGVLLWRCHGACNKTGNVVQLVAAVDKVSISEATKRCEQELAAAWGSEKDAVEKIFRGVAPDQPKVLKTLPASDYARAEKNLAESVEAQEYLKSRGISLETARRLHVGFRSDVGRIAGNSNQDISDKGWLVFPCFEGDRVVSLKYRSIVRKAFCRQPGMKTCLWNCERIDLFEPVLVLEGEIDTLTIEQAGYRAVSIPSASANLSPEDLDKIASATHVFLAGDVDGGKNNYVGQKAMDRIKKAIPKAKRILWPEGMKDANDTLMKHCQGDPEKFKKVLQQLMTTALISPMEGVVDAVEGLKYATMNKLEEDPNRLTFPWKSVDGMAILLPGSVTTVYASQTGCGKSIFTNQVAIHNARERGDVVLNYQCELSFEEMYNIIAAHVLRKDRNTLDAEDGPKAAEKLKGVKYYIGRDPNITTLDGALDLIEKAIKHLGVTIAIIDHIHHFSAGDVDNEVKQQAAAMQRIKRIGQETGAKIIVVSQPRKSDQTHERKKGVNISAIKGSEAITSAADFVIGMHRDMLTDFDPSNPPRDLKDPKTEIHSLKARAQGTGGSYAELMLNGSVATFFEVERRDEPADALF